MSILEIYSPKTQRRGWWTNCRAGQYFLLPATILWFFIWAFVIASAIYSSVLSNTAAKYYQPINWHKLRDCDGYVIYITYTYIHISIYLYSFYSAPMDLY